jgi:hypothetical protein
MRGGISAKEELMDNDDAEHERILNTPIMDGRVMDEASADLAQAIQDGGLEDTTDAAAKLSAIVRKMLENTADLYQMDHERMAVAAIAAVFDMAEDASLELQRFLSAYAKTRLELLAQHH